MQMKMNYNLYFCKKKSNWLSYFVKNKKNFRIEFSILNHFAYLPIFHNIIYLKKLLEREHLQKLFVVKEFQINNNLL